MAEAEASAEQSVPVRARVEEETTVATNGVPR